MYIYVCAHGHRKAKSRQNTFAAFSPGGYAPFRHDMIRLRGTNKPPQLTDYSGNVKELTTNKLWNEGLAPVVRKCDS